MASFGDKIKAFGKKITGQAEPEPETLPQQLLRQVDEATTLTWKQVSISASCNLCCVHLQLAHMATLLLCWQHFNTLCASGLWTISSPRTAVYASYGAASAYLLPAADLHVPPYAALCYLTDHVLAVLSHWYCCAAESNWFWNHLWNWYPTQLSGKSKAPCLNRITQQLVSTHASSSCLAGGTACTRVMALQLHCGAAREMGQAQHVGLWCG
jgi:hypothetical protein